MDFAGKIKAFVKSRRKADWIGYGVLGAGVLAFAAVSLMALGMLGGGSGDDGRGAVESGYAAPDASELARDFGDPAETATAAQAEAPPPEPVRRQENLKPRAVTGDWQAQVPGGVAVLKMDGQVFQLIVAYNAPGRDRRYISGVYEMSGDIVYLAPRNDWRPPRSARGGDVEYDTITTSPFPVMVSVERGRMIWRVPPEDIEYFVPSRIPLLAELPQETLVWRGL